MSDTALRTLERAALANPEDEDAQTRHRVARERAGYVPMRLWYAGKALRGRLTHAASMSANLPEDVTPHALCGTFLQSVGQSLHAEITCARCLGALSRSWAIWWPYHERAAQAAKLPAIRWERT